MLNKKYCRFIFFSFSRNQNLEADLDSSFWYLTCFPSSSPPFLLFSSLFLFSFPCSFFSPLFLFFPLFLSFSLIFPLFPYFFPFPLFLFSPPLFFFPHSLISFSPILLLFFSPLLCSPSPFQGDPFIKSKKKDRKANIIQRGPVEESEPLE